MKHNANKIPLKYSKLNYSQVDNGRFFYPKIKLGNCYSKFFSFLFSFCSIPFFLLNKSSIFFSAHSEIKRLTKKGNDSLVRKKNKGLVFQIMQKKNSLYSFTVQRLYFFYVFLLHSSLAESIWTAQQCERDSDKAKRKWWLLNRKKRKNEYTGKNATAINMKVSIESKSRKKTQILF